MASAMAIVRKRTPALIPCRGSWHAPAPTRYRFAIQSAGSRLPLPPPIPSGLHDARRGGGRWAAWAWAGAAYSSLPGGDKDGGPRLWRALHDIKAFAQRQERLADGLVKNTQVLLDEQSKLTQLVLELKAASGTKRGASFLYFCLFAGLLGWSYTRGTEQGMKTLDEFVTDHVSKIITDPKIQRSIEISAATCTKSGMRTVKDWMLGVKEEAETVTRSELASRATSLAALVLSTADYDTGIKEELLIERLGKVGVTEVELIKKTLNLLVKSGYIEKVTVQGSERDGPVYTVINRNWIQELASGKMQVKIKDALGWKWWNSFIGFN